MSGDDMLWLVFWILSACSVTLCATFVASALVR